jgi:hypothetical protein
VTTREYLQSIGACQAAIDQVGSRFLNNAVQESVRADWLFWLVSINAGLPQWPTREEVVRAAWYCLAEYPHSIPAVADQNLKHALGVSTADFASVVVETVKSAASVDGIVQSSRLARFCVIMRSHLAMPFLETLDR